MPAAVRRGRPFSRVSAATHRALPLQPQGEVSAPVEATPGEVVLAPAHREAGGLGGAGPAVPGRASALPSGAGGALPPSPFSVGSSSPSPGLRAFVSPQPQIYIDRAVNSLSVLPRRTQPAAPADPHLAHVHIAGPPDQPHALQRAGREGTPCRARLGLIDRRMQADTCCARRSGTPKQVTGSRAQSPPARPRRPGCAPPLALVHSEEESRSGATGALPYMITRRGGKAYFFHRYARAAL